MRAVAPGRGPRGAAAAGALLLRADGAGRRLLPAAPLHPHALRPVLLAALRLAAARPPRLGAAGAALAPRPARARRLRRSGRGRPAQPRPAGLLPPALRAQVRRRRAGGAASGHRRGWGGWRGLRAVLGAGEGVGLYRDTWLLLPDRRG